MPSSPTNPPRAQKTGHWTVDGQRRKTTLSGDTCGQARGHRDSTLSPRHVRGGAGGHGLSPFLPLPAWPSRTGRGFLDTCPPDLPSPLKGGPDTKRKQVTSRKELVPGGHSHTAFQEPGHPQGSQQGTWSQRWHHRLGRSLTRAPTPTLCCLSHISKCENKWRIKAEMHGC